MVYTRWKIKKIKVQKEKEFKEEKQRVFYLKTD